ncbi:MAG: sulfate ABC transporter permease subunit CysW [Verrucomicrobiae bacterium]|nr:sulfate ABC transporter permease subunit CysW [Verrucomicrobiae bacterium]
MAGIVAKKTNTSNSSRKATEGSPVVKWILILLSLTFLSAFLLFPLVNVFAQALAKGFKYYIGSLMLPESRSAIKMTLIIASIAVPLNMLFGIAAAWAITKFRFPGKALLLTIIDLPFSISPVVAGLMYVLLYGLQGHLGQWLDERDIQIIFNVPGMVLVTIFVTLPFVARELIPIMQTIGVEQEHAALTLGANGLQTFWHVTLPSVKWGLLYGLILCNARAMGEFGAVSVVSGHITGKTDTMPLMIEKFYNDFNSAAAFSLSSLLALLALLTLAIKTWLEWRERKYNQKS